jgi:hypothetical protein
MASTLLALGDRIPNTAAIALSPTMGWLLFGAAVAAALLFISYADLWRRWWLTKEDPRGIAVFRIVFGFFVVANINGMWEYFEYLYTDEGIFPTAVAREVFAREQFAGFGDGTSADEPWGFFDAGALWQFLRGPKWSLLYFWDSPAFFWAHLFAFELAGLCLILGFRTRLAAAATWFLMNSILVRNQLAWEGTEVVYRTFLVYLVFAKSGHAYSIDNWLRCRKLRRAGLLSDRGGPGNGAGVAPSAVHPEGLEAIYRLIPSWPRKLIMFQLATIYVTTGTLKTGGVWLAGDSLYYAMNLDHFYRLPPQFLASLAGTTVLRAMTWAVKIGQTAFPLILFGIIARWAMREKVAPLVGARRWLARASFASIIGLTAALVYTAWPVHHTPAIGAGTFVGLWVGLWGALWLLWRKLQYRPIVLHAVFGRTLARPVTIDREWMCKWFFGRRVLLVWHLAFHAHIFTLMSVGQFQTGMLSATFAFLEGREIASLLRDVGHRLAQWKVPFIPASVARGEPVLPAEDPRLPSLQRNPSRLPMWALYTGLAGVVAGVVVRVELAPKWDFRWIWVATVVFLAGVAWVRARQARDVATPEPTGAGTAAATPAPWAYGALGRLVLGLGIAWHLTAVATWLLPDKDCLQSFRGPARGVFSMWLTRTTTEQGWGMFAPNPPRSNVFMKVLVTDHDGHVWDMRSDVYAEERKPIPWIWNDRLRKMNRRIIGGESGGGDWYRKWFARWQCRQWSRDHGGVGPTKVELIKITYRIPTPEQVAKNGYYIAEELLARTGREEVAYTEHCERAVLGQLPNEIRARDGLPLLDEGQIKPWEKKRHAAWERRQAAKP